MSFASDTTPIAALMKAGEVEFLEQMCGSRSNSSAVADELPSFHEKLPDFIAVRQISVRNQRLPEIETLGKGENEAIRLALEIRPEFLITNDRKARLAANRLGLGCIGLLGLVETAKQTKRLSSVQE